MSDEPFNERAATWDDDPSRTARAQHIATRIMEHVPLDESTRLLEYGAGTGLLATALSDAVGPITVADRSSGMLDVLRTKADGGPLAGARVWDFDVDRDPIPSESFDLIASALVLHHVTDPGVVIRKLAQLLEPTGWLAISDLDAEDGSFHRNVNHVDVHNGFDRDEIRQMFATAGMSEIEVVDAGSVGEHGRDYPLFLAIGRRS